MLGKFQGNKSFRIEVGSSCLFVECLIFQYLL